jgi:uncharacterized protein
LTAAPASAPLDDADIQALEALLDGLPAPLEPLDVCAIDGLLCGVVLQPRPVPAERWLALACDADSRAAPAGTRLDELHALLRRRHAEIERAIGQCQWFDPWIFQLEDDATPGDSMLPWVAGFAAAMEAFPALMDNPSAELVEPLALLFMHFDPGDLEDADELLAVIDTLEPPEDLDEAVQNTVRALMLMADVTRPRAATPRAPARRPPPRRPRR